MSIMDRIKKIRIGGVDFEVRANPELVIDDGIDGSISTTLSRIEIDSNISHQCQAKTLLHEVVHGIMRTSKLDDAFENDGDKERCVDGLAFGLLQVIRDNPALIAEIQGLWEDKQNVSAA